MVDWREQRMNANGLAKPYDKLTPWERGVKGLSPEWRRLLPLWPSY
jgi:hypothetical protein